MSSKTFKTPSSERVVIERHDLLAAGLAGVEIGTAAVERGLRHLLDDALEVLALRAGARERRDLEVAVEGVELLDERVARALVGVRLRGQPHLARDARVSVRRAGDAEARDGRQQQRVAESVRQVEVRADRSAHTVHYRDRGVG